MKYINKIGVMMMAAGVLVATSCSDFNDYNEAVLDTTPEGNQTLWQNIQQNAELSDFAALVQKAGFNDELDATHYYTVWAPKNGTFDFETYNAMSDANLLKQFVKNHIASYSHNASGNIEERVLMLNEKSYDFVGNGSYTFDGVTLAKPNQPSSNGVLHVLEGEAKYYPNIHEFITDTTSARTAGFDSLNHFFLKYELTYLDESASVPGPIVNGLQTYVDSVMVTYNSLWNTLSARINREDSTYTFLFPTNEAWNNTLSRMKSYYNYLDKTVAEGFGTQKEVSASISASYMQDSLAHRDMMRSLTFSNNDGYNKWLIDEPTALGVDTLRTTTGIKLSNPQEILGRTVEEQPMSNGIVRFVDSLAIHPWEIYQKERSLSHYKDYGLSYSTGNNDYVAKVIDGTTRRYNVTVLNDPQVQSYSFNRVTPTGGYALPELDIFLPDVLSTTYEFYCVFADHVDEAHFGDSLWTPLPNRLSFTLNYCDVDGKTKNHLFTDESPENEANFKAYYDELVAKVLEQDPNAFIMDPFVDGLYTSFSNNPYRRDTVYLGDFTFPVCYKGLTNNVKPNIKIKQVIDTFNDPMMIGFDRTLRIAAILLRPKELVEFEEQNKQ